MTKPGLPRRVEINHLKATCQCLVTLRRAAVRTVSLSLDLAKIPFSWEREVMWVMDIVHAASPAGDGYDKTQECCPVAVQLCSGSAGRGI